MPVSDKDPRVQYTAPGGSIGYATTFPFLVAADLVVLTTEGGVNTTRVLGADYTVTGGSVILIGDDAGQIAEGTVTASFTAGALVTIFRQVDLTQESQFKNGDDLNADVLTAALDKSMMATQQNAQDLKRALLLDPATPVTEVVFPLPETGKFLRWNADESGIENADVVPASSVVFATTGSTNAGTATTEAVTPKGLHDSVYNPNGKHLIPILAGAMQPATTNGAAPGTVETSSNKVLYRTLDFDTTTQEFAGFSLPMPKSWNESTVTFRARWTGASGSGGVAWALQGLAVSDDDAIDAAYGTEQVVTDTLLTAGDMHVTAESSAITFAGTPAEGDSVMFRVKRVPANGSDTLAVDARLIAIDLFITTNAGTDA